MTGRTQLNNINRFGVTGLLTTQQAVQSHPKIGPDKHTQPLPRATNRINNHSPLTIGYEEAWRLKR